MLEEMQSAYAASSQHLCDHGTNSSNACMLKYLKCQLLHKCFTTFTSHMPTFTGRGHGQQSRQKMNETSRTLRQQLTCLPLSSSKMRKVGLSAITPGFEAPTHSFQCHKPAVGVVLVQWGHTHPESPHGDQTCRSCVTHFCAHHLCLFLHKIYKTLRLSCNSQDKVQCNVECRISATSKAS